MRAAYLGCGVLKGMGVAGVMWVTRLLKRYMQPLYFVTRTASCVGAASVATACEVALKRLCCQGLWLAKATSVLQPRPELDWVSDWMTGQELTP